MPSGRCAAAISTSKKSPRLAAVFSSRSGDELRERGVGLEQYERTSSRQKKNGAELLKTDAALAQFISENKLENTAAGRGDFFDLLMAAAQKPNSAGFAWCNETRNVVMAALGFDSQDTVVTRGWYRVAPGKCLRPDLTGKPQRLYSFAEAIGADGLPLKSADRPIAWGGSTVLCTRNVKFELNDHKDCSGSGLTATGFATVELTGSSGTTVQFK